MAASSLGSSSSGSSSPVSRDSKAQQFRGAFLQTASLNLWARVSRGTLSGPLGSPWARVSLGSSLERSLPPGRCITTPPTCRGLRVDNTRVVTRHVCKAQPPHQRLCCIDAARSRWAGPPNVDARLDFDANFRQLCIPRAAAVRTNVVVASRFKASNALARLPFTQLRV